MRNVNCRLQNDLGAVSCLCATRPASRDGRASRTTVPSNLKFSIFIFQFAILLLVSRPSLAGDEFPPELVRFQPYDKNPVFRGAGGDAWDAKIRERGWIIRDGDAWRMWYTGYDASDKPQMMLGYATSPDGLIVDPPSRESDLPRALGRRHDGRQTTATRITCSPKGLDDQAQLLTSRDGLRWKREGRLDVRYVNGKPLTAGPYGTPTAWFENGDWHLFYERSDEGVWLARSTDLKVWTNVQDEPVLSSGARPSTTS